MKENNNNKNYVYLSWVFNYFIGGQGVLFRVYGGQGLKQCTNSISSPQFFAMLVN